MIQDDTYTVEEVCATLDSASADLCTAIVTFHRTNSYSLQLDHYEYSEVDGLIVYVFTYDSNYDVVEVNEFRLVNTNIENQYNLNINQTIVNGFSETNIDIIELEDIKKILTTTQGVIVEDDVKYTIDITNDLDKLKSYFYVVYNLHDLSKVLDNRFFQ